MRAVLFDFDFTLADSSVGVILCVNHALAALGLPPAEAEQIKQTIGLSLPAALKLLTGVEDADASARFRAKFLELSEQVMVDRTVLYDTVPAVLQSLRARGVQTAIVSTKFRERIARVLERERLSDCFDVVVGGEDVGRHKPDPAGLRIALKRLGQQASEALYVGDHVVDAEAASRCPLPFVAVLTGTSSRESFDAHGTRATIEDLSTLPDLVARLSQP